MSFSFMLQIKTVGVLCHCVHSEIGFLSVVFFFVSSYDELLEPVA